MAPMRTMITNEDAAGLRELLAKRGIEYVDDIDATPFESIGLLQIEDYAEDDEEEATAVSHWEVGWSWWSSTQELMADCLGENAIPATLHLHALNGVAVPGDIENTMIGAPILRQSPEPTKRSFLQKLFAPKDANSDMNQVVAAMVSRYGGPYENLLVASSTKLLEEMNAAVEQLGLNESEMESLYQKGPEDSEVGKCYLLMSRAFLREAVKNKHLAWWIK
jgi:hypothetical protein